MGLELLFSRRRTWQSVLIRVLTGSVWSHVDLIDPDDGRYVLGAAGRKGVHRTTLATRLDAVSKAARVVIPTVDGSAVKAHVVTHLGKAYDWPGLLHFIFPFIRQDPERLFCSELIAGALLTATRRFGGLENCPPACVTPEDLWTACRNELLRQQICYVK